MNHTAALAGAGGEARAACLREEVDCAQIPGRGRALHVVRADRDRCSLPGEQRGRPGVSADPPGGPRRRVDDAADDRMAEAKPQGAVARTDESGIQREIEPRQGALLASCAIPATTLGAERLPGQRRGP